MHCIISMQSLVRSHCMERSQGLLCRRLWPGGAFNCTKTETVLPGRFHFLAYDTSGLWAGDVERNDLRKENENAGENYGTTAASGSGTNERRKKGRISGKTDWFVHRLKTIRRRRRVQSLFRRLIWCCQLQNIRTAAYRCFMRSKCPVRWSAGKTGRVQGLRFLPHAAGSGGSEFPRIREGNLRNAHVSGRPFLPNRQTLPIYPDGSRLMCGTSLG